MGDMTLCELCESIGVVRRAIQGYENAGLVCAIKKNKYGYLLYGESTMDRIEKILMFQEQEVESSTVNVDDSSLEGILQGIKDDCTYTVEQFGKELEKVSEIAGVSYEAYVENKQMLSDWYELVIKETENLFERTKENSVKYLNKMAGRN